MLLAREKMLCMNAICYKTNIKNFFCWIFVWLFHKSNYIRAIVKWINHSSSSRIPFAWRLLGCNDLIEPCALIWNMANSSIWTNVNRIGNVMAIVLASNMVDPSGAICLPIDYCFSGLALSRSNQLCWSSTKRTSSSLFHHSD